MANQSKKLNNKWFNNDSQCGTFHIVFEWISKFDTRLLLLLKCYYDEIFIFFSQPFFSKM